MADARLRKAMRIPIKPLHGMITAAPTGPVQQMQTLPAITMYR